MVVEAPALSALPSVRHAFFTREGGVSGGIYAGLNGGIGSNDDPAAIRENRRRMAQRLGVSEPGLLSLYQIHSATVVVADRPWDSERPKADAMVTNVPGLALGISTADCGPVLFADAANRVVGAAHAGWKGALGGVLEATIAAMEQLGANRKTIVAALGPTISRKNYEVGPEFIARFREEEPDNVRFFTPGGQPGHFLFDLPGYIGRRMERSGIGLFADTALCTYDDEARFFSYRRTTHRREPDYGRQISAICFE